MLNLIQAFTIVLVIHSHRSSFVVRCSTATISKPQNMINYQGNFQFSVAHIDGTSGLIMGECGRNRAATIANPLYNIQKPSHPPIFYLGSSRTLIHMHQSFMYILNGCRSVWQQPLQNQ